MVVSDYFVPLACIRVTAGNKKLKKSYIYIYTYIHNILLVPHPPMPHPTAPTLRGWGGAGRGVGARGVGGVRGGTGGVGY
jgi:hypothetical protein